jgi:hypothetical protein
MNRIQELSRQIVRGEIDVPLDEPRRRPRPSGLEKARAAHRQRPVRQARNPPT